jgi:hypothetical protein
MTTEQNKSPPQHTPGPWLKTADGYIETNETVICAFWDKADDNRKHWFQNHLSNARLIAAAPELLVSAENLQAAILLYADTVTALKLQQQISAARAAIAKARGQQ